MSVEENLRDRIMQLEYQQIDNAKTVAMLEIGLHKLELQAAMGKGAWALIIRLGAMLVAIAGAFAWVWDRFGGRPH
jgi:hypothetical protein